MLRKYTTGAVAITRNRGLLHLGRVLWTEVVGNRLGVPVCGRTKELLFWEKQAIGVGVFSRNFADKVDRTKQRRFVPEDALQVIRMLTKNLGRPLEVLDVGAGPISLLTWAHHEGLMKLTATDILASEYAELLSAYGHEDAIAGINLVSSPAEEVASVFGPETFDFAFCNNAIDHTDSPRESLRNLVEVVRPSGIVMISGHSREGTNEGWDGVHMHDLYVEGGRLYRAGRDTLPIMLSESLPVTTERYIEPEDPQGDMMILYRRVAA